MDEQELPFSVRLLLNEGGMIQCACMNSKEQKEVLAGMFLYDDIHENIASNVSVVLRKGAAAV